MEIRLKVWAKVGLLAALVGAAGTIGAKDVKLVAHRGEESLAPEGSLAAYRLAVEHKLDIMKMDLCVTKDGELVMSHDTTLKRMMDWDVAISNVTLAEIREKGLFHQVGPYTEERIATFREALAVAKALPELWLDFKNFTPEMAEKAVAELAAQGVDHKRVMVATFNKDALRYFREHHPDIRRVGHIWIGEKKGGYATNMQTNIVPSIAAVADAVLAYKQEMGLFGVNMPVEKRRVTAETITKLRQSGLWVSSWFVNDPETAAFYRAAGSDAFVTAGAKDTIAKRATQYADRWYYCSRSVKTEADLAFHRDLLAKAKAGGFNGMLYAHGLDYWYAERNEKMKANFRQLRTWCDEAGIEIIPLIWSTGYGAFAGRDLEMAECEPVTGISYVAQGGLAIYEPGAVALKNGDFAQYDLGKNRFAGWWADDAGVVSFVDSTGGLEGGAALRMEPGPGKNKYDHARLNQVVKVKPGRRYRFSLKIRAEDLVPKGGSGALRVQVYGKGPKAPKGGLVAKEVNGLLKEEGWRAVSVDFSSGELDEVILYAGTWGATGGRFWVDDCSLQEIGLREINRRAGTPFVVRSAVTGQEYVAGRDYELPPARMPKGGDIAFKLLPGGAISEGTRLLVDTYVPARHGPKCQISTCMSDPRLYEILEKSAAGIMDACAPKKWFLSVDEVRNGNTCPLCTARHTDMAHILGDCVTRMHAIIKKVCPEATIYAWSDMFDPNHNAVDNYYGCKGTYEGVWDLIPKDIVMSCWYRDRRDRTVPFFTRKGFRVQAGAYYDSLDYKVDKGWMDTLNRTPNATGWMYTTWNAQYELMEKYGKFMNRHSKLYGVWDAGK